MKRPMCPDARTHAHSAHIFGTFTIEATTDPALIPQEDAGSSRPHGNPRHTLPESPALAGNARLSPLSPDAP
jgi:hypothetical protein